MYCFAKSTLYQLKPIVSVPLHSLQLRLVSWLHFWKKPKHMITVTVKSSKPQTACSQFCSQPAKPPVTHNDHNVRHVPAEPLSVGFKVSPALDITTRVRALKAAGGERQTEERQVASWREDVCVSKWRLRESQVCVARVAGMCIASQMDFHIFFYLSGHFLPQKFTFCVKCPNLHIYIYIYLHIYIYIYRHRTWRATICLTFRTFKNTCS